MFSMITMFNMHVHTCVHVCACVHAWHTPQHTHKHPHPSICLPPGGPPESVKIR